jgi:hypothetical protein
MNLFERGTKGVSIRNQPKPNRTKRKEGLTPILNTHIVPLEKGGLRGIFLSPKPPAPAC